MKTRALQHFLRSGGVIAYPTESCFGLGCDPSNRLAVQRLLRIKGRPQRKGLIVIASRFPQLKPYIAPPSAAQQQQLFSRWPGPHTWLVPTADNCPAWLKGRHTSLAVRVTAHKYAAQLCRSTRMALVSTSANHNGRVPAKTTRDCYRLFGHSVKVLPGRTGGASKPSTIQDLLTGKILRP
ncbi:Sua5/YciO/YrdC/YwlC family protein [Methylobacillus gramineus]|uniref:L-threonylcarbamoyladenylate synthase n=1 Tax=Methylobacillus gramineus TaxID=755169 RepID=UPI001CFF9B4F|nr:Sua5/YciO/YrdC/YwlC family protein [Methylobacillus gramineus]MCB5185348.1 Sua5/YciO/YrdC/YwlC family protein [Methylobacillus gramineus]